jgi:hypothetical protein
LLCVQILKNLTGVPVLAEANDPAVGAQVG